VENSQKHIPVLLKETLDLLNLRADSHVVDCTLGLGGHSKAIVEQIPKGKLMVFEQDEANLRAAKDSLKAFNKQITFIHDNFEHLSREAKKHDFKPTAILFDLGLSSPHVDDPGRGFSFRQKGPLDMRFDKRQTLTAEKIINTYKEAEIADILYHYGDECRARVIARKIIEARKEKPIKTTLELAELIAGIRMSRGKIHPATQSFQALRIAVNREMEVLEQTLDDAINLLSPGGILAVISYHSLEDRLVKQKFRYHTQNCICPKELPICQCNFQKTLYILTKKPIIPTGIEVSTNPRSRSAKLRVARKQ
jgi:16S rRNA (cytosine1402-N4)-methyltransferase